MARAPRSDERLAAADAAGAAQAAARAAAPPPPPVAAAVAPGAASAASAAPPPPASAFGPVGAGVPWLEGWLLSAPQRRETKEGGSIGTFSLFAGPCRSLDGSTELARFAWFLSGTEGGEGGTRGEDGDGAAEAKKRRRSSSLLGRAPETGDELLSLASRSQLPLKVRLSDLVVRGVRATGIPVLVPTGSSRATRARAAPALPVASASAVAAPASAEIKGAEAEGAEARPPPRKTPRLPVEGTAAATASSVRVCSSQQQRRRQQEQQQQAQQQAQQQQQLPSLSQAPALPVAVPAAAATDRQRPLPPAPRPAPFVLDAGTIARVAAEISAMGYSPGEATRALLVAKARQDAARGVGGDGETIGEGGASQHSSVPLSREEALKLRAVDWLLSRKKG